MKNPIIMKLDDFEVKKVEKLQKIFGDNKPQSTIRKIIKSFELKNEDIIKNE